MPNIELHGFLQGNEKTKLLDDLVQFATRLDEMEKLIKAALAGASYYDQVVLESYVSGSDDLKENPAPYLRIWATKQDELDDIVKRLDPLDIDIELPPLLTAFIYRKSTREKAQELLKGLRPVAGTDSDFDYEKGQLKPHGNGGADGDQGDGGSLMPPSTIPPGGA